MSKNNESDSVDFGRGRGAQRGTQERIRAALGANRSEKWPADKKGVIRVADLAMAYEKRGQGQFLRGVGKRLIASLVRTAARSKIGRYIHSQVLESALGQTQFVEYQQVRLQFSIPNALNKYRVDTFATKEPETLEWIDSIPKGAVVWDIGANVGLYTCYAAKARSCRVFAFEPSVFNLELLARNIFLNRLTDTVTIVPLPLSDRLAFSKLNMTTTDWGGALSTFDCIYGQDGKPMDKIFEFPTIGISMDDVRTLFGIPQPDYIKMDVDGIEHLIVKGGMQVLRRVQGVSIEVNDMFSRQSEESSRSLRDAGLSFVEKRHAAELDSHPVGRYMFNQIWTR